MNKARIYTEDYSRLTDEEVVMTYNAVMANAYPGDEVALKDEKEKRGLSAHIDDMFAYPCPIKKKKKKWLTKPVLFAIV